MFVQIIEGKVHDPELLARQIADWRRNIKPGAKGYLGSTSGVTSDGTCIVLARFESEEAARRNSERPEQAAWWTDTEKAFTGDVTFRDCREVDTLLGGGSNEAGFVQVMQGRAKDTQAIRDRRQEFETALRTRRPDLLGATLAWHGDGGGFTLVNYYTSEQEARRYEKSTEAEPTRNEFTALVAGPITFIDLTEPDLD